MKRFAVVLLTIIILLTTATATVNGEELPTAVPVPVWSVGYNTYTAQFIGEDKVVVYTFHGDMDLGFRYISVIDDDYARIYDIKTGKLIKEFHADGDGDTWDISTGSKVWGRGGVFSGNGKFLLEDPYEYGTGARVVDLETGTTYPINWTGTAGTYYACQMDYYGQFIAVGEKATDGRVLVFKFNGSAYNLIWNSTPIGDIRRLFITLDAQYLVYGALAHNYLYIAEKSGDSYEVIAKIPLEGGVGALTCTDPYDVGYILVGTDNGHIYIFDTHNGTKISDPDLVVHLNSTQTGTTERFYNPFYNRWNPIHVTAVAFATRDDNGDGKTTAVIVDLTTGKYYTYTIPVVGKASSVSLRGNYIFAGNALFMLIKPDPQAKEPRIRFHGDFVYNPTQSYPWELKTAFAIKAPKDKPYHIYFESGSIKITYVMAEYRPVSLITDSDIKDGKLGKMYDKGLVRYDIIYTDGAEVNEHNLTKRDDRTVVYEREHVLKTCTYARFIGVPASTADSGVIIEVPLNTKLTPYSDITLDPKFTVTVVVPHFNPLKELVGIAGLEIAGAGASHTIAKKYGEDWIRYYLRKKMIPELVIKKSQSMWKRALVRLAPKMAFIPAIALAVDAGVEFYTHYENLRQYENIKTTIYTIPILVDTKTGVKYAVVEYYLPQEASKYESDFREHVTSYLERLGIKRENIKIRISYITDTWEHYNDTIHEGRIPKPNLLELAKMITNVPPERLRIDKIVIIISTITQGYASAFEWLGGGYHLPVATIVHGNTIEVTGIISKYETKDPDEIASFIPKVEINGKQYDVSPSKDGAIAQFSLPTGTDALVVRFPNAEHLRAWFTLEAQTLVKVPMVDKGGYCEAEFHYDWKYGKDNLVIITKKMEFVDMPYPMLFAERKIILPNGRVEALFDISKYFELNQTIDDSTSPSGKRYYYITQDPKFLDPANGARMQTCKRYIFRYWYGIPPSPYSPHPNETIPVNGTMPLPQNYTSAFGNAWVRLYLNGTTNTSVIPRTLVVWLGSTGTANNTIEVRINMSSGYLDEKDRPVYTMKETKTLTFTLRPNETYTHFIDIQKFIAEAIKHAPRGFFEAVAEITKATYNKVLSDDISRVVYFPPSTIPQEGTVVVLNVKVVDAVNLTAVQGANVYIDDSLFGTTGVNGWVNGTVTTGLHRIKVERSGYETYEKDINVFGNMSITIELVPLVLPTTYHELEVLVQYNDGAPYEGASVTVKDNSTGTTLFTQATDSFGLAEFMIEHGKVVDVSITAGNYTFNFTGINMVRDYRIVATVPETSPYFEPEVAIENVTFKIHWGMGWFYGKTPHLVETWVFTNVPQTITLHYRAFDDETNETLNETDLTVSLHKGVNYIMNWVYLGVRNESRMVRVEVSITSYEQDTNLENNRMVSNVVMIKPFVDLSVTVLWKPVKQKNPYAILPEDVIEIDVGFMIPCKLKDIEVKAVINSHDLYEKKFKPLERHEDVVASMKPNTTIWYNTTVTVPFTDKIVVNASIHHPWEYMGWNNYINTTIEIFPDTAVKAVYLPLIVNSGQKFEVTVKLMSNAIGRGATIAVSDDTTEDLLGTTDIEITKPEMDVKFTLTAPTISGFYETHTWNVSSATVDYWSENDYKTLSVTIWNIPWWAWLLIFLILAIFVLSIIKSIVSVVKDRMRPRYRFFRRLEGGEEEETAERLSLSTVGKGIRKFRFFRKL